MKCEYGGGGAYSKMQIYAVRVHTVCSTHRKNKTESNSLRLLDSFN